MANNPKLQIKNSQLAGAINMSGLKAKLTKKKNDELIDDENESIRSKQPKSLKKAPKSGDEGFSSIEKERVHTEASVSEARPKKSTSVVQDSVAQESSVSALIEPPRFSTLEGVVAAVESESVIVQPQPEKKIATGSSSKQPQLLAPKKSTRIAAEKKKSAPTSLRASFSEGSDQAPPRFLSAMKSNPDSLGPVIEKSVPKPAPKSEDSTASLQEKKGVSPRSSEDRPSQKNGSDRAGSQVQARSPYPPRERSHGAPSQSVDGGRRDSFKERPPRDPNRDASYRGGSQAGSNMGEAFKERPPRDFRESSYPREQYNRSNENRPQSGKPPYQPRSSFDGQGGPRSGSTGGPSSVPRQGGYQGGAGSMPGGRPQFSERASDRSGDRSFGPQQGSRPFAPRPPFSQGGKPPYPRKDGSSPSGFRPQPFATRSSSDAGSKAPALWDRAQPQKEGLDERSLQRRQMAHVDNDEKKSKFKEPKEKEGKTVVKKGDEKGFDSRLRHGIHSDDDEEQSLWKRKRLSKFKQKPELQEPNRPTKIKVRLPISVKDLASEMKLKASQLISKLFLQGMIITLNDLLDDETIIQLLGNEFGCEVVIDTSEQERLQLAEQSIKDEIKSIDRDKLVLRSPVIAFMGHVDHGKTSLIDAIRKTNRVQGEAGAITQHIGAFACITAEGPITILDTPGHEAFSAMRERGAEITDIAVLVVAGDEGMKAQTIEALNQAREAHSTIVVAINKSDKPAFDQEKVYRQLAEHNLLPEAWGGQTITVNCSAVTGEGIKELLEMIALQSEVLELQACPEGRARGTVIESEMHKGLGPVATVLVQNGRLKMGDCVVFDYNWAKIKSMKDDRGVDILFAGPSAPVRINGLSGFPNAGEEFVVVASEKEARAISEARQEGRRHQSFQMKKKFSIESMAEKAGIQKKVLNVILRADVHGSLEALKTALMKIESQKVELNIIFMGVGEVSESDVQLANASKATIIGFHTQIESHAEPMMKQLGVQSRLHDIIYHAHDDVREMMKLLLDKIPQENETGAAEVKAIFKSSHLGIIAGCQVTEGSISRNSSVRVVREGKVLWKGAVHSLKRFKDDVKEVGKGMECGIVLHGFSDYQIGDLLQAYDVTYLSQEL